jgi:hypothetical protein
MPETKSGRVHILHQLAVPGGVAAEDTGNYLLLSLTRRSQRCRSGSEISGAGLYQRQGARGRCRSVEGCGIFDELNDRPTLTSPRVGLGRADISAPVRPVLNWRKLFFPSPLPKSQRVEQCSNLNRVMLVGSSISTTKR